MSTRDGTEAKPRAAGVIHDLGYRHYDGPRLSRGSIARALAVESTRGAYGLGRAARAKVMPMLLLAAICFPALVLGVVTGVTGARELPADYTSYLLNVQLIVMVYAAGQAPATVSRDLRFHVVPLYFSRPLHRSDYVLAKYAAMTTALFVLMALPLTVLLAGAMLAELPLGEQLPDYLRSLVGALLLALVLAGIALVVAAATPRRGLGVAAIIAVLAVLTGVQAAVQGIAVESGRSTLAGWAGLLSPFTLVDGVQDAVLGADTVLPAGPPGAAGAAAFLALALLLPVACLGLLLLRYRKVSIS